jgi:small conductance mechanosensitive channel
VARAAAVAQEVAGTMVGEEGWRPLVVAAPEVHGVETIDADRVILRLTVRTTPGEQWAVQRELRVRLKTAFDAEGIRPASGSAVVLRSVPPVEAGHRQEGSP